MDTDRQYTGQRWEAGIGLYDYNARYYDPALGRFVQADTIVPSMAHSQDFNRYSYVRGNPLKYVDSDGHSPIIPIVVGLGIAVIAWLAHPEPVQAPGPNDKALDVASDYGDKAYFDSAPGSGDLSDAYAMVTGHSLFTGDPQNRLVAGFFTFAPFLTIHSLKYLRHIDDEGFQRLLRLGARNGDEVAEILNRADPDAVIRAMTDRAGNQIFLTAGNRNMGLKHIIGRHLTGEIPGTITTFFSDTLRVGDVTELIAHTIQNGNRTLAENGYWIYTWDDDSWGTIMVVVNEFGEVISARPK
jgi:RHS repeat-associated protein